MVILGSCGCRSVVWHCVGGGSVGISTTGPRNAPTVLGRRLALGLPVFGHQSHQVLAREPTVGAGVTNA